MCKYCEDLFTGDYGEDLLRADVKINEIRVFGIQTYLMDCGSLVYLRSDLIDESARVLARESIKIQYCPYCGRKFDTGES